MESFASHSHHHFGQRKRLESSENESGNKNGVTYKKPQEAGVKSNFVSLLSAKYR